jgi:hypothetical protein
MRTTIRDAGDLKAIAKQLREQADGKQLRKELTGGMREALQPLVPVVRAAYLAGPSKGLPKTRSRKPFGSLRALLAKSVRVEVRTTGKLAGVRIRADGRRMPSGMRALPRYWEGPTVFGWAGRWRHPVFPDADRRHRFTDRTRTSVTEVPWVQQESHPTFYRTLEPYQPQADRKVQQVLDDVRRELERRR